MQQFGRKINFFGRKICSFRLMKRNKSENSNFIIKFCEKKQKNNQIMSILGYCFLSFLHFLDKVKVPNRDQN